MLAAGVISYFRLSSDTRMLRSELTRASGAEWRQQIGLNVGSVTLGLVRAGLSFAPLDPKHGLPCGRCEASRWASIS